MSISKNVRKYRNMKNMTQEELGSKLGVSGKNCFIVGSWL